MPPRRRTHAIVSSSSSVMQSHSTFPSPESMRNARCPIAKLGSVWIEARPGSSSRIAFRCVPPSRSIVVHSCPFAPTYCRESSQIGHSSGAVVAGGYATPHVAQIHAVAVIRRMLLRLHPGASRVANGMNQAIKESSPDMLPAIRRRLRLVGGPELSFITAGEAAKPAVSRPGSSVSGSSARLIANASQESQVHYSSTDSGSR
jgi:hypothetical protein